MLRTKSFTHTFVAACSAAIFVCAIPAAAQTAASRIPRMSDGKPNMTGLWQALGSAADWDIEAHSAMAGPFYQLGAIGAEPPGQGIVEGGQIPYKPAALEQKKKNFANRLKDDPEVKCYMPGVPRAAYLPYPFEIIQSQKDILVAYEYATTNRLINMGKPQEAATDTWMGTSNGHWEKDTLVVDVTGFNGNAWLDRAGDYTTDSLHVVERYTLLDANTMNYEATIEDSQIYTAPWKINLILYRHREKDARLLEFKCVEFAEELLYGDLARKPAGNAK
jgi:hypothetical protein